MEPESFVKHICSMVMKNELYAFELHDRFHELSTNRRFFLEWFGEHSVQHRLANALTVLASICKFAPAEYKVLDWVRKYPLYAEWLVRLEELMCSSQHWPFPMEMTEHSLQQLTA